MTDTHAHTHTHTHTHTERERERERERETVYNGPCQMKEQNRQIARIEWNDTGRSATYDFLLVFRSNYTTLSYRLLDK